MPSESGENQTAAKQPSLLPTPPSSSVMGGSSDEPPSIPCPRCESTNTKFCYYNNYNLSQPRHFCKSCRRYWTQGGSLRNVPVGGGSRKSSSSAVSSSKRHRSSASSALTTANNYNPANIDSPVASTNTTTSSSSNSAASLSSLPDPPLHLGSSADPCLNSAPEPENFVEFTNLKETRPPVASETEFPIGSGSFISLLNNQSVVGGGGGGYQTGFFPGYYDMGFTLPTNPVAAPRGISWPYYTTPTNPTTADYLGAGDFDGGASTWQHQQLGDAENANGGGGAYVDAEGFAWPSFVIPSPAKGLMK